VTGVLLASLVLVAGTACLLSAAARPRSAVSFVLGAFLAAWAELVAVVLGLSLFDAVSVAGLLISFTGAQVAAILLWYLLGMPRPAPLRPGLWAAAKALRDPPLAILAVVAAAAIVYAIVLGTATPQNEWDALSYHLARAALWAQQGFVGYIPDAYDVRINGNPPDAEIGLLAALLLGGDERFTWIPQLTAALATGSAVFGIGRRMDWDVRSSLFGALVFLSLPLIILQMSSALNDLVVAAFFAVAVYFALGNGQRSGLVAALALALGIGTKLSAPLLLAVFAVVVLLARRDSIRRTIAITAGGVAGGSLWYLINLVQTGTWDGGLAQETGQNPDHSPGAVAWRAVRLTLDSLELPGTDGNGGYLYPICAAVMAAAGLALFARSERRPLLRGAVLVLAIPSAVVLSAALLTGGWHVWWRLVGRPENVSALPPFEPLTLSDSTATWFGPAGVSFVVVGLVCAVRSRGEQRVGRIALAASPVVFIIIMAAGLGYDPWRGRFFIFPVALAAATWGAIYQMRAFAWGAAGLVVATTLLVLTHSFGKPPGVRLLAASVSPSVFGAPRWKVESWMRTDDGTAEALRYVEEHVPARSVIGLALRVDDFTFPYFGRSLNRTIVLLPRGRRAGPNLEWIVRAPGRSVPRCESSWRIVLTTAEGFAVIRRINADRC
jgi:hypothetical protein